MSRSKMKIASLFLFLVGICRLQGQPDPTLTANLDRVGVFFADGKNFTLEQMRLKALDQLRSKGFEPLTNAPCSVNIALSGKEACVVIFVEFRSNELKRVQQVVFDRRGRLVRAESGPSMSPTRR